MNMHSSNKIHNEINLCLEPTIRELDKEFAKKAFRDRPKTTDSRHIFKAAIDHDIKLYALLQSRKPQTFLPDMQFPWIVIICDRYVSTSGIEGFHEASLKDLFRLASQTSIITSQPADSLFMTSAITAGELKKNAIIIETLHEKKDFWIFFAMENGHPISIDFGDD